MHLAKTFATAALVIGTLHCGTDPGVLPAHCEAIAVDASRELVVTDVTLLASDRLAFSRVMSAVLGPNANQAARTWMNTWSTMPGESTLDAQVIEPWSSGDPTSVDLTRSPFELVAITNRVDFWPMGNGRVGELRFVYGLVNGATRLPMTVIVELQYPPTRTPNEWAEAWHLLGSLEGDAYASALMAIVDEVLGQPLYGQLRTQDARELPPHLAEFDVSPGAALAQSRLVNTPSASVDPAVLASFISAHETEVLSGDHVLPEAMLASFTTTTPPALSLPGVDAPTAAAFARSTCNGCHTAQPALDGTFHVSPLQRGAAALSPFLTDPQAGAASELDRRAESLRSMLCN